MATSAVKANARSRIVVEPAILRDLRDIEAVLAANRHDRGLFQRNRRDLVRNIRDFLVARDGQDDRFMGCVALHVLPHDEAEVLTLAVLPQFKKHGVGSRLMEEVEALAKERKLHSLWAITLSPEYFRRHGYRLIPRLGTPGFLLRYKLAHVLAQHFWRWPAILLGRWVFLRKEL